MNYIFIITSLFSVAYICLFVAYYRNSKKLRTIAMFYERKIKRLNNDVEYRDIRINYLTSSIEYLGNRVNKLTFDMDLNLRSNLIKNDDNLLHNLSKDELKKIRFYIHPDKTNGTTNDLFLKINERIK